MEIGSKRFNNNWREANMTYEHYREGTGTDLYLNYSKAYREDSLYKKEKNVLYVYYDKF